MSPLQSQDSARPKAAAGGGQKCMLPLSTLNRRSRPGTLVKRTGIAVPEYDYLQPCSHKDPLELALLTKKRTMYIERSRRPWVIDE